ncbi:protein naked cuticle homolog 1 isoform X2 [Scleropages formosus]|uniref:protein naked cuticle homolog 1 isoform X2 n=1 Tax=Scleropages formosus TaxID=113540 RepID=UPI0008788E75|nr:protein naked cuticle homolog 1-like isoform X2 [Scleropages formosus]
MGKLHSKHHATVCKPRESPEGDSFVVNACLTRKGMDDCALKHKYYCTSSECARRAGCGASRASTVEVGRDGTSDHHYRLEVALPPEKTDSCCAEDKIQGREGAQPGGVQKQLKFEELECAVSVEEDNRQEWTFTLYDFDNNGKVTREDITSLLHAIYEVVDASVNHSPSTSKTLRVKLSVAPDSSQLRTPLHSAADPPHSKHKSDKMIEDPKCSDKKLRAHLRRHHSDQPTQPGCQRYCVDENLDRRNHYLDLAGIENYTSRFGSGTATELSKTEHQTRSRSHEPENGHFHPHHRRSRTVEVAAHEDSGRHSLHSPKAHGRPPVKSRGASPPPVVPSHSIGHQASGPYRRHKQRAREAQPGPRILGSALEREQVRDLPSTVLYEGGLPQVVQRHQHHHHHEHHHHYHHFYQS